MNAITKFRLCTLTDDELLGAVDAATDEMYETGKIPDRQIPARPDADFDLIVGELICRFIEVKNALIETRRELRLLLDIPSPINTSESKFDSLKTEFADNISRNAV